MTLRVPLTPEILLFECCIEKNLSLAVNFQIDALRNLVPSVQFKKPEKQPWRIITSKVSLLLY